MSTQFITKGFKRLNAGDVIHSISINGGEFQRSHIGDRYVSNTRYNTAGVFIYFDTSHEMDDEFNQWYFEHTTELEFKVYRKAPVPIQRRNRGKRMGDILTKIADKRTNN